MRAEIDPDWQARVYAATDELLDGELGKDIEADAKRYCPTDTGALRDSIEHHLEDHNLIVSATGSDERAYAAYVELGHLVAHGPGMREVGPAAVPPQPFLRPALYQQRSG